MSAGPRESVRMSSDILQLIGDLKGAAKAVKSEIKEANKEAKAAAKELQTAEPGTERDAAQARLDKAQKRVNELEDRRDRIRNNKESEKKTDSKIVKALGAYHQAVGLPIVQGIRNIASGNVRDRDLQAIGQSIRGIGGRIAGTGFGRLGAAVGQFGGSIASSAIRVGGAGAFGGIVAKKLIDSRSSFEQSNARVSEQRGQMFDQINQFLVQNRFTSRFDMEELDRLTQRPGRIARNISRQIFADSPGLKILASAGLGTNRQAELKAMLERTEADRVKAQDIFGRSRFASAGIGELDETAIIRQIATAPNTREMVRKELIGNNRLISGLLMVPELLTGTGVSREFIANTAGKTQDLLSMISGGFFESTLEIEAKKQAEATKKAIDTFRKQNDAEMMMFRTDPVKVSQQALMFEQLRASEEFRIDKQGFWTKF